jgi:hypothetical protein
MTTAGFVSRCVMKGSGLRWLAWGLAATASLTWVGCRNPRTKIANPLPAVGDVRSVTAHYFDLEAKQDFRFDVPLDRLPSIYKALQPATFDSRPAKWAVLGELEMTLRNGQPFRVDLYYVWSDKEGAFSAGETFERRTYFRGGSSSQLTDALRSAREAASRVERDDEATPLDHAPNSP